MNAKEMCDQIYYLDFIQRIRTGDPPEVKILGSGTVSGVKVDEADNIIYILGDGPASDDFIKGYRQAVTDIQVQLKDRVVKKSRRICLVQLRPMTFRETIKANLRKRRVNYVFR